MPPTATKPPDRRSTVINDYGRIGSHRSSKLCVILSDILWKHMQCIPRRQFRHWKTKSRHDATRGIGGCHFDNLRCHQRRQSRHHGNSRPSADVLRVEIFAKANLPLAQIPPPRRRDVKSATSVVLSSFDLFLMPMRACRNAPEPIPVRSDTNRLGPIPGRHRPATAGPHV